MVHNKSGFNIDPYHGNAAAELMADFFEESKKDPERWDAISRGSLERIKAKCVQTSVMACVGRRKGYSDSPGACGISCSICAVLDLE